MIGDIYSTSAIEGSDWLSAVTRFTMISNILDLKMELIKELSMLRYQLRCGELLVVPLHCQLYQALNRLSFSPIFQREFTPYKSSIIL